MINFPKDHKRKSVSLKTTLSLIAFVGFFIGKFADLIFPLFSIPFYVIWIGMMIPFLRWKVIFYHFMFTLPRMLGLISGAWFLRFASPILVTSIILAYALSYCMAFVVYDKMKNNHVFDWVEVFK